MPKACIWKVQSCTVYLSQNSRPGTFLMSAAKIKLYLHNYQ
jgi:hypothetical protein